MGTSFRYNPKLKPVAKELRKKGNLAEVLLWKQLQKRQFEDMLFHRETTIHNFMVDFCCEKSKIIIEVDGSSHDNKKEHDADRTAILNGYGFHVIRVTDKDILHDMDRTLNWLRVKVKTLAKCPLT